MTIDIKPKNVIFPIDQPSDNQPPEATTAKRSFLKSRTALALGIGSLGLIFGLFIDGGDSTQTAQAAVPVATVAEARTAPAACIEALDTADKAFDLAGDGFTVMSTSYSALAQGDFASADAYAFELAGITEQITLLTPGYQAAKTSCRGI